ncbi:hypothetical protein HUX88_04430 [Duganella sp. BJB1802]|uniref:hypothetical protein n=1 Tax=Duganella sp. BJB1802 TaxID=2744575 RepID=UPI001594A81F|nr:hypothetical protein [Duganella sp. BJB1802]NVD69800.1 hypothetical protein [Duganella sp. BJB1802]
MNDEIVLKKTKIFLFLTPFVLVFIIFLGGILGFMNLKHENIAYVFGILLCFVVGFIYPHYVLGRSAQLLGSSWVYFGLLPILFVPIGMMVSWLLLIEKRAKFKALVEQCAGS